MPNIAFKTNFRLETPICLSLIDQFDKSSLYSFEIRRKTKNLNPVFLDTGNFFWKFKISFESRLKGL